MDDSTLWRAHEEKRACRLVESVMGGCGVVEGLKVVLERTDRALEGNLGCTYVLYISITMMSNFLE